MKLGAVMIMHTANGIPDFGKSDVSGNLLEQVDTTITIPPLVIIPGNELEEGIAQTHAGTCIKNGRSRAMDKISRNNLVFSVLENP